MAVLQFAAIAALPSTNSQIKTNTPARIRMATLYAIAAIEGAKVVNTGNRSEAYVGYTTKWGDGQETLLSLLDIRCVKCWQLVMQLVFHMTSFISPSVDGMSGLTDEDNLGFTYEDVDSWLLEGKEPPEEVFKRYRASWHKRTSINLPHPLNL